MGLDIEPGFVAAAEFSNGGSPTLQRAATGELRPGLFHEGEVTDVDGLADQLRTFFRDNDLPKVVRLGVASQKIVVRVIELPDIEGKDELEAAVRFQAQEELPMPLEQAVLDHRVLEKFSDGESTRMRVLMVAARRETIDHLLAAARKAGLDPQLIDLSAFAIVRALYVPPTADGAQANGSAQNGAAEPLPVEASVEPAVEEPVAPQQPTETAVDEQPFTPPAPVVEIGQPAVEGVEPIPSPVEQTPPAVAPIDPAQTLADLHGTGPAEPEPAQAAEPAQAVEPAMSEPIPAAAEPQQPELPPEPQDVEQPAIEASPIGPDDALLYCHVGGLTNLAIATGTECVFNRVLQSGVETMAATLAERKALTLEHGRQWIKHVGLERPVESIEGDQDIIVATREVLERGVSKIADELRLSMEYYRGSVPNAKTVNRIVLAGPAIALAGFPAALEREVGLAVEPRSLGAVGVKPGALDNVDGAHVTVAAGLAINEVGS